MSETFLHVEYREKDEVKRLGAYWSREQRQWYVPAGRDLTPFARWLPDLVPALPPSTNKTACFSGCGCLSATQPPFPA